MRRIGALAGGLVILATLAACGQETTGNPQAGSSSTTTSTASGPFNSVDTLSAAGTTAALAKKTAKLDVKAVQTGSQSGTSEANAVFRLESEKDFSVTFNNTTLGQTITFDKQDIYTTVPANQRSNTGGKPWAKLTKEAKGEDATVGRQAIQILREQSEPTKIFQLIKTAGTMSAPVTEQLDGVATTKYVVTIDIAKAAASLPDPASKDIYAQMEKQEVKGFEKQIWLDSNNLPVRIVTNQQVKNITVVGTINFTAWGQPVDIVIPPADQVFIGANG